MMGEGLREITITYYANDDGLQRVVCEETEIDLDVVPEENKNKWFISSGEIVGLALFTSIVGLLNGDLEEEEEDEDEEPSIDDILSTLFRSL